MGAPRPVGEEREVDDGLRLPAAPEPSGDAAAAPHDGWPAATDPVRRRRGRRVLLGVATTGLVGVALVTAGLLLTSPHLNEEWRKVSAEAVAGLADTPGAVTHDCPFTVGPDRQVECGTLVVPLDRSARSHEVIELAYARLRATGDEPAADPLVYLEGGPGGYAVADWSWWYEELPALLVDRDLILLDQRGVGFSAPALGCPELHDAQLGSWDEQVEAAGACHDRLVDDGHHLSAYSTREIAADVADLRRALNLDEVNLLGVSYGTRVALAVLRDSPQGVRSVVLDSTYPLEVTALEGQVVHAAAAIDEILTGCAGDEACDAAHPDLAARLDGLVEDLNAEPALLAGLPLWPFDDTELDGEAFVQEVFWALYAPGARRLVPEAITTAADGDVEGALGLLAGDAEVGMRRDARADLDSDGLYYSVTCREEAAVADAGHAAGAAQAVREPLRSALAAEVDAVFAICDAWDAGVATPEELAPAPSSDVPALVLAGTYDPITPSAWGAQVAEALGATYVEFDDLGHAAFTAGPCPLAYVTGFLDDPSADLDALDVDSACGDGAR